MRTLDELVKSATSDKYGYSRIPGRFEVRLVDVGRPSTGLSSADHRRIDCYLDGRRVKKSALIQAMENQA